MSKSYDKLETLEKYFPWGTLKSYMIQDNTFCSEGLKYFADFFGGGCYPHLVNKVSILNRQTTLPLTYLQPSSSMQMPHYPESKLPMQNPQYFFVPLRNQCHQLNSDSS